MGAVHPKKRYEMRYRDQVRMRANVLYSTADVRGNSIVGLVPRWMGNEMRDGNC